MTAITICSDFGAQKNKVSHCFHCFPIYLPWSDGTRCHDLSFLKVELLANFLISSASVRSIPFLSFIEPTFTWNVPLVSLIFLKRSLVIPILLFSSISLHWLLRKAFLSLLAILWNSAFRCLYISFCPLLLLLFFSQLFLRPPQTAILPFCISFSWGWSWSLPPVQCQKLPTDLPVRGFPGVWKLLLFYNSLPGIGLHPSLLSLFLSFVFCPTSFRRQWAAFLGAWCPLPVFRRCLWYLLSVQMIFQWICQGESGFSVLFLCHLTNLHILDLTFDFEIQTFKWKWDYLFSMWLMNLKKKKEREREGNAC